MATRGSVRRIVSPADLERLGKIESPEGILSVYLKIDPRLAYDRGQAGAKFKGGLKRFTHTANEHALQVLEREKGRVLEYLQGWEPKGRSLVIFAGQPAGLWEMWNLGLMLPTYVAVDERPHLQLLQQAMDEYPRMAVVMLDGGDAGIYLAVQGEDEEVSRLQEELPGRHDQGGWAQARFQRHVEFHHSMHLKAVLERLEDVYYRHWPFDTLVVAGVSEAVEEFRQMLPDPIARRYLGSVPADFKHESAEEILERARRLRAESERESELALVREIADNAAAGGRGAVGIEDTISAVVEKRVRTLAVAEGVTLDGSLCPNCGYVSAKRFDRCPVCGSAGEDVPDVIEYAAEKAFLDGARVEVLFGEAREDLLALGGVGALLRY